MIYQHAGSLKLFDNSINHGNNRLSLLEYGELKRLVRSAGHASRSVPEGSRASFELVAPQAVGVSECVIQLEGRHGKRGGPGRSISELMVWPGLQARSINVWPRRIYLVRTPAAG
jgi:hypothetical protein